MPRKSVKEQKAKRNRIRDLKESLLGLESPDELMNEIISRIKNTEMTLPTTGKYYTFIYYATTPKIVYDQHPLIIATELTKTGFRGFNYHMNRFGQYNLSGNDRLVSGLYEITEQEFLLLRMIPYKKLIRT